MTWNVNYTDDALQDLQDIYDYIALTLLEPAVAEKQSDRIMDAVDSLDDIPHRYRLYDKEPWHSKGLRILPVDHYLIFYLPDEAKNTVSIIRIMYGGRDIVHQLNQTDEQV
uniref:Putative plasmid stabilisation protein n=1 Tax=termite gut metagenome TaxID=433724 RepID=S0DG03_9ZZZZ